MATGEKIHQRLAWSLALGLALLATGLYRLWFTPTGQDGDSAGLTVTVILIAFGLLLLIPAKIYIILRLTKRRREQEG